MSFLLFGVITRTNPFGTKYDSEFFYVPWLKVYRDIPNFNNTGLKEENSKSQRRKNRLSKNASYDTEMCNFVLVKYCFFERGMNQKKRKRIFFAVHRKGVQSDTVRNKYCYFTFDFLLWHSSVEGNQEKT